MASTDELKRTPLNQCHKALGAKLVPFAGWEMPVRYGSEKQEHLAVRKAAGVFDVSHMGEIFVSGPESEQALNYLTTNNVAKIQDGKALYSAIANEQGGVIDDIIIYRFSQEKYLVCVNAGNSDKDFAWLTRMNKHNAKIENASANYGQIAFQGPKAVELIGTLRGGAEIAALGRFRFATMQLEGIEVIAARTGYTGEDGFEFFIKSAETERVWNLLVERFKDKGVLPCGLAARDSLRLEACYPLHGHELAEDISAIESGLGWVVALDKGDFIGRSVLEKQKLDGAPRGLAGFFVTDDGIVREGATLHNEKDAQVGRVTSGTWTPSLERALGLALVESEYKRRGSKLKANVRGRFLNCEIVKTPFYGGTK